MTVIMIGELLPIILLQIIVEVILLKKYLLEEHTLSLDIPFMKRPEQMEDLVFLN